MPRPTAAPVAFTPVLNNWPVITARARLVGRGEPTGDLDGPGDGASLLGGLVDTILVGETVGDEEASASYSNSQIPTTVPSQAYTTSLS